MDKTFLIEVQNKSRIEELKKFEKELRTNIIKCLDDERKTNEKLDKRLCEVEMVMFRDIVKDIDLNVEYGSEMVPKLSNLFWLYSRLMEIDKRLEDLNLVISDFKEMREEEMREEEMTDEEMTDEEVIEEEMIEELKMVEKA